jgi:hypothetical protein
MLSINSPFGFARRDSNPSRGSCLTLADDVKKILMFVLLLKQIGHGRCFTRNFVADQEFYSLFDLKNEYQRLSCVTLILSLFLLLGSFIPLGTQLTDRSIRTRPSSIADTGDQLAFHRTRSRQDIPLGPNVTIEVFSIHYRNQIIRSTENITLQFIKGSETNLSHGVIWWDSL